MKFLKEYQSTILLRLKTIIIALLGVAVFVIFDLPLPFLFGPMFGCLLASLLGVQLKDFKIISVSSRTILGVAIGAMITPSFFISLPSIATSIAIIPLFLSMVAIIGIPLFYKFFKLDATTAYYATMPGGLQDMVILGVEAGADPRALSLIHATRVFCVITIAPFVLLYFFDLTLDNPIGLPAVEIPFKELLLMLIAAISGWWIAKKIGLWGASILGPMIFTACLSLSDLIHFRPPNEVILVAQFFIGIGVGVHFVGITRFELQRFVLAGITYVFLLAALSLLITWFVSHMGIAKPAEIFLAFAPGGQAEMSILAIASGVDIGFVISHHITRLVLVILGAPIAARFFMHAKI